MEEIAELEFIEKLRPSLGEKLKNIYSYIFILTLSDNEEVENKLSIALGELAFVLSSKELKSEDAELVCEKLYDVFIRSNVKISYKIKNFFEIICAIDENIFLWISSKISSCETEYKIPNCFVSQVITLCRIKKGQIDIAEKEVDKLKENYLAYSELSLYFNFQGNYIKSLSYINKAIYNSPIEIKGYLEKKRRDIIIRMER